MVGREFGQNVSLLFRPLNLPKRLDLPVDCFRRRQSFVDPEAVPVTGVGSLRRHRLAIGITAAA